MAATPCERVAALIGKFVCEEVGLADFVSQHPDILSRRLLDGKNILHVAVQTDDEELVKRVLDAGFNKVVDHRDEFRRWSPLSYAAQQKNIRILNALLDAGADPSRGGPLLFAARNDEACALRLLEAGADPNDCYAETDETCLHCAVRGGNLYLVHELLKAGANPTLVNSLGQTPSMVAHEIGLNEITSLLIRAEAGWPEKQRIKREAEEREARLAKKEEEKTQKKNVQNKQLSPEDESASSPAANKLTHHRLANDDEASVDVENFDDKTESKIKTADIEEEEEKKPEVIRKVRRVKLRTLRVDKRPGNGFLSNIFSF